MARCDCGGGTCNCSIIAGDNTLVTGTGSVANPYKITTNIPCSTVRSCLSAGDGITYDQGTGEISAHLSGQAGNNVVVSPDGGLYVPTAGGAVLTGCGLTGDGTASGPIQINSAASDWTWPCAPETGGLPVVCDADGKLRGAPRSRAHYWDISETTEFDNTPVPEGAVQEIARKTYPVQNPSDCYSCLVMVEQEADLWVNLPTGATYATGFDSDETFNYHNSGTSSINTMHLQFTKFLGRTVLAPSASGNISWAVTAGKGTGGAEYFRINWITRVLLIATNDVAIDTAP